MNLVKINKALTILAIFEILFTFALWGAKTITTNGSETTAIYK